MDGDGNRTFTEVFAHRARTHPERDALLVLPDGPGGDGARRYTYGALAAAARALAPVVRGHTRPGGRVLVAHSDRMLFATSLLACLFAGAVPVPVVPPGGSRHHDARLSGIARDAAVDCALTSRALAPALSQVLARTGHQDVVCVLADAAPAGGPDAPPAEAPPDAAAGPDSVAVLQYTSGSTRAPRGVPVSHRALLAHLRALSAALGIREGERVGGWLPFHHDMGLIGLLIHPLWQGATSVLLSPESFARRPLRWLEAVSDHGIAVSAAPDSAYARCAREDEVLPAGRLDLSHWRTAVSGGESVRASTVRDFAARFAPAGLRPGALTPCYGLAEATLLVTGAARTGRPRLRTFADDGHPGGGRSLVSCGPPAPGTEVRIVDPAGRMPLDEGVTGEIWVRGPGTAEGYWRRPAESEELFRARTALGEGGFLRTGDLGAMVDGELYVTGRSKDLVVLAGNAFHPEDLEESVRRTSTVLGPGIAFGVHGESEHLVVVQELRARTRYGTDLPALTEVIQDSLVAEHGVRADGVLIVRPGTVRHTTSGKVERAAMRGLFLGGALVPLHASLVPEVRLLVADRSRR
ncbi:fatty acyl-AMP ligase [Streptomyces sp. rh34]|uniref:fatty acyl-AMP ligase n=1 Tax=Streptomyces sp. rh34 TaxID=2034272 RepID=UPI000BEFDE32|nr:fatty acyl-AMP ligase [Streptomyces sp. rh34]